MTEKTNILSLGMKKKRLILISGLIFLVLLARYPQAVDAQTMDDIPSAAELPAKITHSLREQIIVSGEDRRYNVIVATTCEVDTTFLNSLEFSAGSLDVVKTFNVLPSFQAVVTYDQISSLSDDSRIKTIEWGDREGELFINSAQYYSNTDDLRDPSGYDVTGDGVTVAILDSGIWTGHDDLDDDQLTAFRDIYGNGTYDDFSGSITGIDFVGHGTAMAGIIAGSGDGSQNNINEGLAPDANLVGVRITNVSGVNFARAYSGLEWIANNSETYGIDIVSCSWGFKQTTNYSYGTDPDLMAQMADALVTNYSLVVVAAVGNTPSWGITSPASGKYVIGVGAVADPTEGGWNHWDSSAEGPVDYEDETWYKPDIMAPGVNIECTYRWDGTDGYSEINGTSPATAFVAGMTALYLEYDGDLANDTDDDGNPDVKQLLWASATVVTGDSPDTGFDNTYGAGRVDGVVGLDFYTTDVSSSKALAVTITSNYDRYNEPMWRIDPDNYQDWYKYTTSESEDWTISVTCDPDLMVSVILYKGSTEVGEDNSTSRGDDCYISYSGTSGTYYVCVLLIGSNGAQGYPGDYYDIEIDIVSA